MKIKLFILIAMGCIIPVCEAQVTNIQTLWTEKPEYSDILPSNADENTVGILIDERYEMYHNPAGNLEALYTMHHRYRLNDDESINRLNKISVSMANVIELVELKARVIKPDGRVVAFDENNIKEIRDESGSNLKIFAIDGIERGDDIEYYVIRRMEAQNYGRLFFQFEFPVQTAIFELFSPANLLYEIKGYNGFPDAVPGEPDDDKNRFFCRLDDIPALEHERYSYFNPRRARIEYRLNYNLGRSKAPVLTFDDAAQRVHEMIYLDIKPRQIDNWLKMINIKKSDPVTMAGQIEEFIKTGVYIQDYHLPEFSNPDFIRKNGVSSERGITALYANIFKRLDINHEVVLTSDRSNIKFDPDFHSWSYLDKYLIYLPDGDNYIEPADPLFRMGCVDGDLTATWGLFVKLVRIGNFESAIGQVRYIEPAPYMVNYDNMNIDITIDIQNALTSITTTRGMKGLSGGYLERVFKTLDAERKEMMLKSFMETKAPDPVYNELNVVEKSDFSFLNDAEFIIYSIFTTPSFLEFAGDKILLSVGESIGPQVELYFDEERTAPGEYGFNRWYYRVITVVVPEGYRISNPAAADFEVIVHEDGENIHGFVSSHTYNDSEYVITIDEYYKNIFVDAENFEEFRQVINAAADFNKVVLVMEKI
jgi:hypothetical protein